MRLAGPTAVVGEPVRIGMSGVEIEGRIAKVDGSPARAGEGDATEGRHAEVEAGSQHITR